MPNQATDEVFASQPKHGATSRCPRLQRDSDVSHEPAHFSNAPSLSVKSQTVKSQTAKSRTSDASIARGSTIEERRETSAARGAQEGAAMDQTELSALIAR